VVAPTCARDHYEIQVDARWETDIGNSYGIIFGVNDDLSGLCLFDINTEISKYRVYYYDGTDFITITGPSQCFSIQEGEATNHFKARVHGDDVTLELNGEQVYSWTDEYLTGFTSVDLAVSSYWDHKVCDARFDNFSVIRLTPPLPTWDTIHPMASPALYRKESVIRQKGIPFLEDWSSD
jgi:hypothetical protein